MDSNIVRESLLLLDNWIYLLPLLVSLLAVGGMVGRGIGLPSLFREDAQIFAPDRCWRPDLQARWRGSRQPSSVFLKDVRLAFASPALWSGFGFLAAFGLFWVASHSDGVPHCRREGAPVLCPTTLFDAEAAPNGPFWLFCALAAATALFLLFTWRELRRPLADFTRRDAREQWAEMRRAAAGCAMGAAFLLASLSVAEVVGDRLRLWVAPAYYVWLLVVLFHQKRVLPGLSLFSVIMALILVGMVFPQEWRGWSEIAAMAALLVVIAINRGLTRHRLPGFDYDDLLNPEGDADPKAAAPPDPPLIAPVEALNGWWSRINPPDAALDEPTRRPVLVLVATSGGAYRAAFWTGLLLDKLVAESDRRWPGLPGDVRLITGASGGMVAGAYFVAMAAEGALSEGVASRISEDTWRRMHAPDADNRRHPIARDSLSPITHQLVTRDLLHLVWPWPPKRDRGHVLDAQWTTLQRSFGDLHASERKGVAPSIILSPMLVETGSVALFSNLDLKALRQRALPEGFKEGDENKTSVEIFRTFPSARNTVSMATAVRLNATFPYVSPAISLPTTIDRRPVDAGYYDNYGIDLMTAYLDQEDVIAWISQHCSGVAIIQIRAFPAGSSTKPLSGAARAMQFLTTPAEGVMSARRSSQIFRNDQQLAQLRSKYKALKKDFLQVFTFEASSDVSMSWYLRCDEISALNRLLHPPTREELTLDLAEIEAVSRAAPSGEFPSDPHAEIEDLIKGRYGRADSETAWVNNLAKALQNREPEALWAQFLRHRARIADEFARLEAFWRRPGAGF